MEQPTLVRMAGPWALIDKNVILPSNPIIVAYPLASKRLSLAKSKNNPDLK